MNLRFGVTLCFVALFASCSDFSRPSADEAKAAFLKRYPDVEIIDIRMSEDEIVARSFEFTYRWKGEQTSKKIDIQFMGTDSGSYEMRPSPPKDLP